MTVADLIDILKTKPKDAIVFVKSGAACCGDNCATTDTAYAIWDGIAIGKNYYRFSYSTDKRYKTKGVLIAC